MFCLYIASKYLLTHDLFQTGASSLLNQSQQPDRLLDFFIEFIVRWWFRSEAQLMRRWLCVAERKRKSRRSRWKRRLHFYTSDLAHRPPEVQIKSKTHARLQAQVWEPANAPVGSEMRRWSRSTVTGRVHFSTSMTLFYEDHQTCEGPQFINKCVKKKVIIKVQTCTGLPLISEWEESVSNFCWIF